MDVRLQEKHGARTATSVPGTDIDAMKHGAAEGSGITLEGQRREERRVRSGE